MASKRVEQATKAEPPALTDEEIFVPEVSDWDWQPKPLSPGRSIQLARLVAEVLAGGVEKFDSVFTGEDGQTRQDVSNADLIGLMDAVSEEQLIRLLAIVTAKPPKWIEENFVLLDAIVCLSIFWAEENLGKVADAVRFATQAKPTRVIPFRN